MTDLLFQSATQQLALLHAGKLSIRELAEEHIRQIERLDPRLNAFIDFDAESVRRQASALDLHSGPRGPLHGLPMSIKSTISVAGLRCETGSLLNEGKRAEADAVVVTRLREAGALPLGTTNCPEFLMAYTTDNRLHGRTANPWDLTRSAGGSSGGESAAIAAGMSAGGLGSDGGGSVREPAHFTGICSLKPTPGRIPSIGHDPANLGPFALLGVLGPMARTVGDVALLFRALSGQYDADPAGVPVGLRDHTGEQLLSVPIGYFEDDGLVPVTPESRVAVQDAAAALRRQGFRVAPYRPAALEEARQLWWKLFVRCGAMLLEPAIRGQEHLLSPVFQQFMEIARRDPPLTGDDVLQAWIDCDTLRGKLLAQMREFPVLLSPVCSVPAFKHDERSWTIDGQRVEYLDAMRYTQWSNLLGSPAAVVPVGRSPEGLPVGVQLAGRPYEDELVLGIAEALEHDFGYETPPMRWALETQ